MEIEPTTLLARMRARLDHPVDARSLGLFRIGFGVVMVVALVRFWAKGWIESLLVEPTFHFKYAGFEWVEALPSGWIHAQFVAMIASAVCIGLGWKTRWMAALFFVLFTWAELIEKAAYLNHYYLVSLLSFLLIVVPTSEALSFKRIRSGVAPRWALWWLRCQILVVYVFAGVAKVGGDWLLRGEPLHTWLQMHADWPLIGPYLLSRTVAIAMSWGGMCFDVSLVFLLLWPRTRRAAYVCALGFHVVVWLMFPIGMFSWIMMWCATLFFAPEWPRHLGLRAPFNAQPPAPSRTSSWLLCIMALWCSAQVLLPLRHVMHPGEVNWTEQGFRFAWRVMLIEKTGQIEYRVVLDAPDGVHRVRPLRVHPRIDLTALQYKMLCTQPDMMVEYALHIQRQQMRTHSLPASVIHVYADAFVSLNAQPSRRYLDPARDLTSLDDEASGDWVLPR